MQNPLIAAAEAIERSRAVARGFLKKKSSVKNLWQRRFFLILPGDSDRGVTYYLAYSKTEAPGSPILASMDLSQAGAVHTVEGDGNGCQFGLLWDKPRYFMASSVDECQMWVATIRRLQAETQRRGGGKDWNSKRPSGKGKAEGGSCCSVQ